LTQPYPWPTEDTLGDRILLARLQASARRGEKMSQEALGSLVAQALGRDQTTTAATVSRWESGDTVPSIATVGAIAKVCGVDPGWLAYGPASEARSPYTRIAEDPEQRSIDARLADMRLEQWESRVTDWANKQWAWHRGRVRQLEESLTKARRIRGRREREERLAQLELESKKLNGWMIRFTRAVGASLSTVAANEEKWTMPDDFLPESDRAPLHPPRARARQHRTGRTKRDT
jgi:transcriptional regulator with XRE-family HTH domain